ncbi:TfoX domain protein [Hyphomonas neptunium ATCC 15444]|uniref:TfoX domain protein n=2 Tax=Hyphomonas TaxID=85 RepID=Q0BYF8_HYPNA|nr:MULTISPECIES: TfoX/Sxy family protein [Hyphomonas]ABI75930.1 TfoX domain protein [Hyphomonas neptunium ATCC 15444]KCZ83857.1 TfoX domain-containing protein [Hyphomonas hirschiana VP5]
MAKAPDPLHEFVLELLSGAGAINIRRMFGGAGVYQDGVMFALLSDDQIYVKVDPALRADLLAEGGAPFLYLRSSDAKPIDLGYVSLPSSAMDDPDEATVWARRALTAARAAKAKSPPKKRKTKSD